MDTTLDGVELGVTLPHGGGLMPSMVGRACESILMSHMEPLIPRLSAAELARAAAKLAAIHRTRVSFSDTVLEEEKTTIAAWSEMLRSPDPRNNVTSYSSIRQLAGVEEDRIPPPSKAWRMARFALANKEALLKELQEYFEAVAKEAERPYTGKTSVRLPDNLIAELSDTVGDDLARQRAEYGNAQFLLVELEVALYRYRAPHGRFPDRIADLVPSFIANLPDDPFGGAVGKTFIYRSKDSGPFVPALQSWSRPQG